MLWLRPLRGVARRGTFQGTTLSPSWANTTAPA